MLFYFIFLGHKSSAGQFLSVRNLLIVKTIWYSGFCLLFTVTRFACDIHHSDIWIWISSAVSTYHVHFVDNRRSCWLFYFFGCHTVLTRPNRVKTAVHDRNCWLSIWTLPHRADETQPGQNSCPRSQLLAFNLDSIESLLRLSDA